MLKKKNKMFDLTQFRFQYITNSNPKYSHIDGAKFALDGGCRWIQLRIKIENDIASEYSSILPTAFELKELCKKYDAIFIIDDYVEMTRDVGADGVHLGKNDMAINRAREILGEHFIIGGTANTVEDIISLREQNVNYIGLGPFRFTETKKNLSKILGIEGYRKIFFELQQLNFSIPIVAIGGITKGDISLLLDVGVNGIAVSGAIINSDNPIQETKKIIW